MNITPEVFDKKCPHCGATIEKQLKIQAFETGYGYREHGVFMCNFCEGDIEFRFEWGVVWSEITKGEEQLPDRSVTAPPPPAAPVKKCQCVCGCDSIATKQDEHGEPLCENCYNDYYGIAAGRDDAERTIVDAFADGM